MAAPQPLMAGEAAASPQQLAEALAAATQLPTPAAFAAAVPAATCLRLLRQCERLLAKEPTVVHVAPPPGAEVAVVGDLHGQFHDLLRIFERVGAPSDSRLFVFDGDLVDRGPWGLEVVLLLAAHKAAAPKSLYLVRGNHETTYCSHVYGLRAEVLAKFGEGAEGEAVFKQCQNLFAQLPLAAVVAGRTLVLHGGLPRAPPRRATRRSLPDAAPTIATLAEIAAASKGGADPEPERPDQRVAADVLWSDPRSEPGIQLGARPGDVGILFGPDVTEAFLRDNGLRCILRGHEGPDARVLRPDMQPMGAGWTLDHDTPAGRLYTVFSAPCYPCFGCPQYDNLGAVAVLDGPAYDAPRFVQFEAAPRPAALPFYGTTEDTEVVEEAAAAEASTDAGSSEASSSGDEGEAEAAGTWAAVGRGPSSDASSGTDEEEGGQQQQALPPRLEQFGAVAALNAEAAAAAAGSAEAWSEQLGGGSMQPAAAVPAPAAAPEEAAPAGNGHGSSSQEALQSGDSSAPADGPEQGSEAKRPRLDGSQGTFGVQPEPLAVAAT